MYSLSPRRMGLLGLGMLVLAGIAPAQTKIAIINIQKCVLDSDEIKKAGADMENKYKPRQQAAQKIEQELQGIQQQLQSGQGKLTPQAEQDLQATGARRQRELQHLQEDLQNDVNAERNDILQKTTQKMQDVVKQVAEAKGFDMVVDTQSTVYFKPAMDITADVLTAYNKAHPAK